MSLFIVCVSSSLLDRHHLEHGHIVDAFVPVEAPNETDACKLAVVWHGDNGVAVEGDDMQWQCNDADRGVTFKATKCLLVSPDEMDFFVCVTQGLSTAVIIGRSAVRQQPELLEPHSKGSHHMLKDEQQGAIRIEGQFDAWTAVSEALPPVQNRNSRRRYMVYASTYGGYVFRCWHSINGFGSDGVQSMISDVTHWRIARQGEDDHQLQNAEIEKLDPVKWAEWSKVEPIS
ncbi:hypothetical protein [Pseudomonas sp. MWU12-2323]|uniref:hypothetical protein n=1 Tax=Pseudomonas sp. MWU12-2323 TaxID=2651296 RepID=UPI00128BE711|nr:hypothetical protein [Pseudomonas sp. MWU12-2323]MPQ69455.1 hypothetical protein [Pseudomonas sp. MWU12-2323]